MVEPASAGRNVVNLFTDRAGGAERERQLADLLDAIGQAQHLARELSATRPDDYEVKMAANRLEAVRLEVEMIRGGQRTVPLEDIDPKWTGLLPWRVVPEL